jgi:hypothetical protein
MTSFLFFSEVDFYFAYWILTCLFQVISVKHMQIFSILADTFK